ncbi:hypothetical protein GCM10027572_13190 [Flexivirga lutea]
MILDEPTSGLDPLRERTFAECVERAVSDGRTVLLSSHILGEVEQLCDTVTIIKDGRLVETGELSQLRHLAASTISAVLATQDSARLVTELNEQLGAPQWLDDAGVFAHVPDYAGGSGPTMGAMVLIGCFAVAVALGVWRRGRRELDAG